MVCKCGNVGVLNTILGKDFYYCRDCKDEIRLEEVKSPEKRLSISWTPSVCSDPNCEVCRPNPFIGLNY